MSGLHEWEVEEVGSLDGEIHEGYTKYRCKICHHCSVVQGVPSPNLVIERWSGGFKPYFVGCNELVVEQIMRS